MNVVRVALESFATRSMASLADLASSELVLNTDFKGTRGSKNFASYCSLQRFNACALVVDWRDYLVPLRYSAQAHNNRPDSSSPSRGEKSYR